MTAASNSPLQIYVDKLERRTPLPPEARSAFMAIPASVSVAESQAVIAREGQEANHCVFVSSGFLTRQKHVNGSRKIIGIGIAGDAVDLQSLWFGKQDHSLVAHRRTTIIAVTHAHVAKLCETHRSLMKALWHDTLIDASIFREWTLNIAHRRARARVAHLFLELATRLKAQAVTSEDRFELPLTQSELAGALGLSLVHFNKSLAALREQGQVATQGRIVELLNRRALEEETAFDPSYLHIETPLKSASCAD